jgi:hypothetical protein
MTETSPGVMNINTSSWRKWTTNKSLKKVTFNINNEKYYEEK